MDHIMCATTGFFDKWIQINFMHLFNFLKFAILFAGCKRRIKTYDVLLKNGGSFVIKRISSV